MTVPIAAIDSGLFLLLAILCLVMLSVSMLRRSQQRTATARELTREQLARLRDQKEIRQSMDELLVQLEECARRINAQVDTRFAKLEAVIRDADQRIARLEQLTRGTTSTGPDRQRIYELADSGQTAMTIADMLRLPVGQVELILNLRKLEGSSPP